MWSRCQSEVADETGCCSRRRAGSGSRPGDTLWEVAQVNNPPSLAHMLIHICMCLSAHTHSDVFTYVAYTHTHTHTWCVTSRNTDDLLLGNTVNLDVLLLITWWFMDDVNLFQAFGLAAATMPFQDWKLEIVERLLIKLMAVLFDRVCAKHEFVQLCVRHSGTSYRNPLPKQQFVP